MIEPGFKLLDNLEEADAARLIDVAADIAIPLNSVAMRLVTGAQLRAEIKNPDDTIGIVTIPGDYTHPRMLSHLKLHVLPAGATIMRRGLEMGMTNLLRQVFGAAACQYIRDQDFSALHKAGDRPAPPPEGAQVMRLADFRR